MPLPVKIENQVTRNLARLLMQWRGKKRDDRPMMDGSPGNFILRIMEEFLTESQQIEDMYFDLMEKVWLDAAEDDQLDISGDTVNLRRIPGWGNSLYRALIRVKILANKSTGSDFDFLKIVRLFTGSTDIDFEEFYPASMHCVFNGDPRQDDLCGELMQSVRPAGVRLDLGYEGAAPWFGFAGPLGRAAGFNQGHFATPIRGSSGLE